jgi:hypothetical protein
MRLYRTGDLARFLGDGTVEYLGRLDHQVKIRGVRIELGEIEATIGQHPAVRDTLVVAREDIPGDKRLVAYIVPRTFEEDVTAPAVTLQIRAFVESRLPSYLMPSAFVVLDSLPLSPNGKLDRRALPVPGDVLDVARDNFEAPRSATEHIVVGVFCEVLGLDRVGVHDSFFRLGGHSLLATQVVSRLLEYLQVAVEVRTVFEQPTPAGLAAAILDDAATRPRVERIAEMLLNLSNVPDEPVEAAGSDTHVLTEKAL